MKSQILSAATAAIIAALLILKYTSCVALLSKEAHRARILNSAPLPEETPGYSLAADLFAVDRQKRLSMEPKSSTLLE